MKKPTSNLKKRVIKLQNFHVGAEQHILDVPRLKFLKDNFSPIYETPDSFYAVLDKGVFRFKKPSYGASRILKADSLTILPETTIVSVKLEELMQIAEKYDSEVWETADCYAILYPGMAWISRKSEK